MEHQDVSRRTLLKGGGAALAGLTVLRVAGRRTPSGNPARGHPVARPAGREPERRQSAGVGSARLLADTCRQLFHCRPLRPTDGLDEATWRVVIRA